MGKLIVVIQCHLVTNRCSGYNCMRAFYRRGGAFQPYGGEDRYLLMTCGGCCGAEIAAKLEDLAKHNRCSGDNDEIIVHLASCVCSDNYHRPPCPHLEYIVSLIKRKGYSVVLGSYISKKTSSKRQAGIYRPFFAE